MNKPFLLRDTTLLGAGQPPSTLSPVDYREKQTNYLLRQFTIEMVFIGPLILIMDPMSFIRGSDNFGI